MQMQMRPISLFVQHENSSGPEGMVYGLDGTIQGRRVQDLLGSTRALAW